MIKPLLLTATLAFSISPGTLQAQTEITASDIARHLGIRIWKIPANKLPERFAAYLMEIKDGKVAKGYTHSISPRAPGDLTITVSTDPDGTCAATLSIGDYSMRTTPDQQRKIAATGAIGGFSSIVLDEPMVLMGEYKIINERGTISQHLKDVENGLAVVIKPLPAE